MSPWGCCLRSAKGRTGPHACACQWATWERQARRACAAMSCARASLEEKLRESDVVGLGSWVTSLWWRQHSPTWHTQGCACELRRAGDRTGCCAMWCPQPFDDETRCPWSVCRVPRQHSPTWHTQGCACELRRAGDRTGCGAMWCPQTFGDETRCPWSVCRVPALSHMAFPALRV